MSASRHSVTVSVSAIKNVGRPTDIRLLPMSVDHYRNSNIIIPGAYIFQEISIRKYRKRYVIPVKKGLENHSNRARLRNVTKTWLTTDEQEYSMKQKSKRNCSVDCNELAS